MSLPSRAVTVVVAVGAALALAVPATAAATTAQSSVRQVSADPYSNDGAEHATEVEPDISSWGDTVVSDFQVGRFSDGGSSNTGWATSLDGGLTWQHGFLPDMTVAAGGPWARASDPTVTFDAKAHTWLAQSLVLDAGINALAVLVSRSPDGIHWSAPSTVVEQTGQQYDKPWITCDNHVTSPFFGTCYSEEDVTSANDQVIMVTSKDAGRTWSAQQSPAGTPLGLGGVPQVRPNGTVVVPFALDAGGIGAFTSTDGGASWGPAVQVSATSTDSPAPGLREEPLPASAIDAGGRVYVAWDDCRFRTGCTADDIVLSTSTDGVTWSPVTRVPIGPVTGGASFFTPGITIDPATSGARARVGLYFNSYPDAACAVADCQIDVGYVSSTDGGATWGAARTLAGPFPISWLAQAFGAFVGDYNAATVVHGRAVSVFAVAHAPTGSTLDEPMASAGPLAITGAQ